MTARIERLLRAASAGFNRASDTRRQWIWFAILWCAGLLSVFVLAYAVRWVMGIG